MEILILHPVYLMNIPFNKYLIIAGSNKIESTVLMQNEL